MKKTIILCFIMLLSFVVVGCSNSNTNNKENTLTCKWNSTENQYLNVEFIFNFNENDELISVDENQSFYNSFDNVVADLPSNTVELKEKIEEGIEYDPEKEKKLLSEEEVLADGDLDGYGEALEDDMLLDDGVSNIEEDSDDFFQDLDDEGDELLFDNDLANDNLDNDEDIIE